MALQGSRQITSSAQLLRLHSSPGLNTTSGTGTLWDRLIFNERNTEVPEVMGRAEC